MRRRKRSALGSLVPVQNAVPLWWRGGRKSLVTRNGISGYAQNSCDVGIRLDPKYFASQGVVFGLVYQAALEQSLDLGKFGFNAGAFAS